MFNFKHSKAGVIIGAGHGIGLSLDKRLRQLNPQLKLFSTYHNQENNLNSEASALNPLNEFEIEAWSKILPELDFVISTVGWLGHNPEKSLRQVELEAMTYAFQVNTLHFPLILKHLYRKLNQDSLISVLSAMVGSIKDNQMGGWYGYRSSKAALNMIVKNLSIELKKSIVIAVHPGTTETDLSKNFLGGIKHQIYTPDETAEHLIKFWNEREKSHSGKLFHWDGRELPF